MNTLSEVPPNWTRDPRWPDLLYSLAVRAALGLEDTRPITADWFEDRGMTACAARFHSPHYEYPGVYLLFPHTGIESPRTNGAVTGLIVGDGYQDNDIDRLFLPDLAPTEIEQLAELRKLLGIYTS